MIKRYISLTKFMKDLPELKDCIVILPYNTEEQMAVLNTAQFKSLKEAIKRLNIKTIIEKRKPYETNKHI